jgi:hypothetical protein
MVHAPAFHHCEEVTVTDGKTTPAWLLEYLKEHDHHKADYQPESKIFIKWIQIS